MRNRRRRGSALALWTTCVLFLQANAVRAALISVASEALTGKPVPDFQAETLDGKRIQFSELRGQAVVVNFFASWCPVCQAENPQLRQLRAELAGHGVRFLGVLVDSVETPETVDEARKALARDPLPYPVVLMNDTVRGAFQYEGFPATYFVRSDGVFTTTLLGYHPLEKLASVAGQLQLTTSTDAAAAIPGAKATLSQTSAHPPWEKAPWLALVPRAWKQWHPLVIHFPIVLLLFEAGVVVYYWCRPSENIERLSRWLLGLAVLSFGPAIYTGLNDVGSDLGPGWAFWNGLRDRLGHLFLFRSSVSLHVFLVLLCLLISTVRLVWRVRSRERALNGRQRAVFLVSTALGLWMLLGAGQVGGAISHR